MALKPVHTRLSASSKGSTLPRTHGLSGARRRTPFDGSRPSARGSACPDKPDGTDYETTDMLKPLLDLYTPDELALWLLSPHKLLDGRTPESPHSRG